MANISDCRSAATGSIPVRTAVCLYESKLACSSMVRAAVLYAEGYWFKPSQANKKAPPSSHFGCDSFSLILNPATE